MFKKEINICLIVIGITTLLYFATSITAGKIFLGFVDLCAILALLSYGWHRLWGYLRRTNSESTGGLILGFILVAIVGLMLGLLFIIGG